MTFRCKACGWACQASECPRCAKCGADIVHSARPGRVSAHPEDLLVTMAIFLGLGDKPSWVARTTGLPQSVVNNYLYMPQTYPQIRAIAKAHVDRVMEIEAAKYRTGAYPDSEWHHCRVDPAYVQKVYDAFKSGAPAPGYVLPQPAPPEDFGVKPILGASVFPAPTGTELAR